MGEYSRMYILNLLQLMEGGLKCSAKGVLNGYCHLLDSCMFKCKLRNQHGRRTMFSFTIAVLVRCGKLSVSRRCFLTSFLNLYYEQVYNAYNKM